MATIDLRNPGGNTILLAADGAISATLNGTSALSAALTGDGALASTLDGTSALAAVLTATGALAATLDGTSALTAEGGGPIDATLAGTSALTAEGSGGLVIVEVEVAPGRPKRISTFRRSLPRVASFIKARLSGTSAMIAAIGSDGSFLMPQLETGLAAKVYLAATPILVDLGVQQVSAIDLGSEEVERVQIPVVLESKAVSVEVDSQDSGIIVETDTVPTVELEAQYADV